MGLHKAKYNKYKIWGGIYGSALCMALFSLVSCKKFLEQEPTNRLSVDDVYKNFEGARTTLVGMYENLKNVDYYERYLSLYAELTGGNIKYSRSNPTILLTSYNFSNTNVASINDLTGFYELGYNTIYRANNVIVYNRVVSDADEYQKNRMLADAYTFRALAHFDLVRVFAQPYNFTSDGSHQGITIRTKNTLATVPVDPPSTARQVFDQIRADLDSAIFLYPSSVPIYNGGTDKTWFSLNAAKAIKLRVSLYMEDWQTVIGLANELATSAYPLVSYSNYVNSWRRSAGTSMDNEAIFMLFARIDQNQGAYGDNFNPLNTTFGYMAASNDLLNLYASGDVRGPGSMFFPTIVNNQTYQFTKKYQGRNDSADNQKLFRISEVILSRAEAYAESNNIAMGLTDLNRIRSRANPFAASLNITGKQELLDSISVERRRELCFEGHGLFDIIRKKKNLVRLDCTANPCNVNYPSPLFAVPRPILR